MSSALFQLTENAEPIPGYRLVRRIGVGGYGEVWKATAPGGLTKAIKFIFGHVQENRAARELKSLGRVKELNHPFLLSLERIELVAGHLVVVTEIADGSLKDLFEQCCEQGLPGVPREDLKRYLREAADALDYLFESHSLQHLDVKPENLLILGGHVKVADFGLLKDLQDTSVSLVNGLTPKYSSPEVFDGRPSRHSDQYSLAVVYQEMATGVCPYNGRTAAQLASQHLHSPPDLSPLTPHERFAVGKALSKDPNRRFRSCCEFVDRLTHRSTGTIMTGTDRSGPAEPGTRGASGLADPGQTAGFPWLCEGPHPAQSHDGQTIVVAKAKVRSLPALEPDEGEIEYRPAVFVGIGGTGGKVLCRLRQLLKDRFGDAATLPALQFVLLDTDIASISEAVSRDGNGTLQEDEAVILPLRRTWDYRSDELSRLRSISRRWIYNVPRSLRTQGLRALGRLALLDHAKRVLQRLRTAVLAATEPDAVATSTEQTGLAFGQNDPRVFVVASLAGGTGGGMVVDVAYIVRQILAESGLSDEEVCGILTYSTAPGPAHRPLAPASAYACLEEMLHFGMPGNDYPGEPTLGLAGFQEDASPLKSTYLVDLGDDVGDDDFGAAVDQLAKYLLLAAVSPAGSWLDKCRKLQREDPGARPLRLRTFGLSTFGAEDRRLTSQWGELLCKSLVRQWRGGIGSATREEQIRVSDIHRLLDACHSGTPRNADAEKLARQYVARRGLSFQAIAKAIDAISDDALSRDRDGYFRDIISESLDKASADDRCAEVPLGVVLRTIDTIADIEKLTPDASIESLCDAVLPRLRDLGRCMGADLKQWILSLIDTTSTRLSGARQAADWIKAYLESLKEETFAELRAREEEAKLYGDTLGELGDDSKSRRRIKRSDLEENLLHYARLKLGVLAAKGVCKTIAAMEPLVTAALDELRDFWKDLSRLSETFDALAGGDPEDRHAETRGRAAPCAMPLAEVFDAHLPAMLQRLDGAIRADLSARQRGLRQVVNGNAEAHAGLISGMRAAARNVILQVNREVCLESLGQALKARQDDGARRLLSQWLEAAVPDLRMTGGATRLLVVAPGGVDGSLIARRVHDVLREQVTVSLDPHGELIACCEVEELSLEGITARFTRRRPDCREMASRLHTRIDVDWRS